MARIFKKIIYRPVPDKATIVKGRDGKCYAVWMEDGKEKRLEYVETKSGYRTAEESPYFVARYYDSAGRLCERSTKCKDRRAAEHKLNTWLQELEKVKAGILSPGEFEVSKRQQKPIELYLTYFQEHLQAKGATLRYIRETLSRIRRVCTTCKFKRMTDLDSTVFMRWLNQNGASGMGARTRNGYREVMMTFSNWAVADNSLPFNPFNKIPKAKESLDKRHARRALTLKEINQLLQAVEEKPLHDLKQFLKGRRKDTTTVKIKADDENTAITLGLERKLLYATMIYTGLRKSELASITIGQVFLDTKIPHIILAAKDEKSRRGATLPLHPELVAHLKIWLKRKGKTSPKDKLFHVPKELSKILNRDLKYAGIEKWDGLNRVIDVHALRHTHATLLAQSGVSPGIAKSAMRHSDIRLTMNVYSHLELGDVAEGINQLPNLLDNKKNTDQ